MFSREDFQRDFNLSEEDVKETLKACGISLKKRSYSEAEKERFAEARKLFDNGTVQSYDQVVNILKSQQTESPENGSLNSTELLEDLELLRQKAIETGFNIGIQQAELMGQVIPEVTIMRLREMIANGELKQNFEQIWRESAKQLGNGEYLKHQIEAKWQQYQLEKYQPLASLPESSTESSTNDF